MIIALLALAVAMILGGLLTTLFGWDIVLVERGWTMVIAGSVTAASGAILLGIAAAVSKLSRIQSLLSQLQEETAREAVVAVPQSVAGPSLAAASVGVIAAAAVADAGETEAKDEAQPVLPLFDEPFVLIVNAAEMKILIFLDRLPRTRSSRSLRGYDSLKQQLWCAPNEASSSPRPYN